MRSTGLQFLLLLAIHSGAFFFSCASLPHQEVSALMALKRDIFEDPLAVLADWDSLNGEPCNWFGVICSIAQNHVVSLNLSKLSLKVFLAPELGQLSFLKEIILKDNLFSGTIPKQIGLLKNLLVLDLSKNRLSGLIPAELGNLTSITMIYLHYNGLIGSIPPEFFKLLHLFELRLDRNRLIGPILGNTSTDSTVQVNSLSKSHNNGNEIHFCHFPRLKLGVFSYNFFAGKIPLCLKYLPRSSFKGNCLQDEYAISQRTSQKCDFQKRQGVANRTSRHSNEVPKHGNSQQPEWLLILEGCTGAILFVLLITAIALTYRKCKHIQLPWKINPRQSEYIAITIDGEMLKDVLSFSRQELEVACEDFSNIIGTSRDSVVYKGTMKNGPEIAVISLCTMNDQWSDYLELYFHKKVEALARINNENTTKLLGYCKQNNPFSRMLIFDYASNGTLYEHLHYGEVCHLSWYRRMKISLGIACSLRYLHTELHPPFAISELNSGAVHLTENFTPKLVDFESWQMVLSKSENSSGQISSGLSFHSLIDCAEQRLDVQCNTYAFGVLLLEIVTRRHPFCKDRGCLVDWAAQYLHSPNEMGKLVDPELKAVKFDELAVICSAVSLCINPDASKRPSMRTIAAVLENGIDISAASVLKDSPLAWADLALAS
ncbi:putative LRR receptor-like serine/threonine-protein kinase [Platanthera zijinensis]|uniref:LRR receptor-like serine/threonine-protein kinase n=1 Tax=Platanthera zijinensis TaxID=2320716 RepID=A0AAP0BMS5_9ASPA